ncbi:MAG: MBL fold metallo-hydrolase [Clostridia bacterium]
MTKKKICFIVIGILSILVILGVLIVSGFAIKNAYLVNKYELSDYSNTVAGDRIHFLNVTNSDAILLESNGKFAMVDCAEDTDNPRNFKSLDLKGHEEFVINYIKQIAGDKDGKVTLEFVIGTHSHSDHIGGFDTLINDKNITVKKAYLKKYDESIINDYEKSKWDNKEVYEQMINACIANNVEIVQDLANAKLVLGNFNLTIFNGENETTKNNLGENENSLGVLVQKNEMKAFLAGDMNNIDGDEDRISLELGKIDLLKVGHHGYDKSTTKNWIKRLKPNIAIVPNYKVALNLPSYIGLINANSSIFGAVDNNGIVAQFEDDKIVLYKNLHK